MLKPKFFINLALLTSIFTVYQAQAIEYYNLNSFVKSNSKDIPIIGYNEQVFQNILKRNKKHPWPDHFKDPHCQLTGEYRKYCSNELMTLGPQIIPGCLKNAPRDYSGHLSYLCFNAILKLYAKLENQNNEILAKHRNQLINYTRDIFENFPEYINSRKKRPIWTYLKREAIQLYAYLAQNTSDASIIYECINKNYEKYHQSINAFYSSVNLEALSMYRNCTFALTAYPGQTDFFISLYEKITNENRISYLGSDSIMNYLLNYIAQDYKNPKAKNFLLQNFDFLFKDINVSIPDHLKRSSPEILFFIQETILPTFVKLEVPGIFHWAAMNVSRYPNVTDNDCAELSFDSMACIIDSDWSPATRAALQEGAINILKEFGTKEAKDVLEQVVRERVPGISYKYVYSLKRKVEKILNEDF